MQEKKKIFQPKVIIGSITSFIVAAVGVVAVFFPDLLNLQKKSLNEAEFFMRSDKDNLALWKFLKEHQGKAIKLTIEFCPSQDEGKIYAYSEKKPKYPTITQTTMTKDISKKENFNLPLAQFIETFRMPGVAHNSSWYALDEEGLKKNNMQAMYADGFSFKNEGQNEQEDLGRYITRYPETEEVGMEIMGAIETGFNASNFTMSGFSWSDSRSRNIRVLGKENYTFAIFDDNHASKYIKDIDPVAADTSNACQTYHYEPNEDYNDWDIYVRTTGYFSGYFFVNEMKTSFAEIDSIDGGERFEIELDPISRKEFELKNY